MIRTVTLLCLLVAVSCQYPRQRAPPMRDPQPYYDDEEPQDDYRPQAPPRVQPPPARRSSTLLRPASVHYVNIGQELAGDYKFGYDTGKGEDGQSFREETRLPDGSVQGAYGYVDDTGTQRIVKYIAGKDGFKVLKDGEAADKPAAQAQPAQPAYRAPVQSAPPAQPAYRAPVQSAQPAYRAPVQSAPPAQPAYRAPVQSAPPAQPAYRAPAQPAYRAPVQSAPPAQPAYRAPAQPAYRAPPAPQRSYEPEPRPNRRQYAPPKRSHDDEYDYDYPENEIRERRLVPVDTTLFNYNIGTQQGDRE